MDILQGYSSDVDDDDTLCDISQSNSTSLIEQKSKDSEINHQKEKQINKYVIKESNEDHIDLKDVFNNISNKQGVKRKKESSSLLSFKPPQLARPNINTEDMKSWTKSTSKESY